MTKLYPIQVIALDKIAHQALDLAELSKFDEISKIEPKQLSSAVVSGYHQILVLSELNADVLSKITEELALMEDVIILLPNMDQESEEITQLILLGVRVIFSPLDTLLTVSLSHTLEILEIIFYGNNTEMEISTDHEDIYQVMIKGTVSEFYEESGANISTTMMSVLNTPKGFSNTCGALVLFEVAEDFPIMDIADTLNIAEDIFPKACALIFETRNTHTNLDYVKIICMVSRYVDFKPSLQQKIHESRTYLNKVATIIDAYAEGLISGEEADLLGKRNEISIEDLGTIYEVAYENPIEIVKIMRAMKNEKLSEDKKIHMIAKAVVDTSIDNDVLEEIALTHKLSIDEIISTSKQIREE